jgi:pimeloyl-ACP methyl ester carboxylesterase
VPRWRRTAPAIALAGTLFASGCAPTTHWVEPGGTSASGSPGATATGARAAWHPCQAEARAVLPRLPDNVTYSCAMLKVPADWSNPGDGKTFDLALIRARTAGQSDRIGSLVVNPGGPGASGFDLGVYLSAALPTEVTRSFDIVGFDPRGVGRSSPVRCISDSDLDASFAADPDPVSAAAFARSVALTRTIDEGCGQRYGEALPLFSTEQAARDIDAIRAAVGDRKLTYLGYSYGTLLGATYAQLFPTKLRAAVLDGAIDPKLTSVQSSEGQAKGFELAFTNFATWCGQHASSCAIAQDPRTAVVAALAQGRASPVAGPDGRRATAGWIFTAIVSALYSQETWPQLASAIAGLSRGDARGIFELADSYAERDANGHYSNLFDANTAVNCADDGHSATVEQARAYQAQWRAKYPLFGAPLAIGLLACSLWPGKRDPYPTGAATGSPPILVVGTTGDPATPYEQTAKLASMLGTGRVLTWRGEGHTAYPQTRCVISHVDAYLVNLTVPAEGTSCPAQ